MEIREEDQPPEEIWLDDEALEEHFRGVKEKYSKDGGSATEAVPQLTQNELTKGLRDG